VRGYLRRCGPLLGIDCERLLEDFELQYQEYVGTGEHEDPTRDAQRSRVVLAGSAALGAVIAIVLTILLWPG
jgi:cytoskeletal protein RodZ